MRLADHCWKTDILVGLVFTSELNNNNTLSKNISYTIRPPAEQRHGRTGGIRFTKASDWYTSFNFPRGNAAGSREVEGEMWHGGIPGYWREGFLTVQRATDLALILELNSSADVDSVDTRLKRYPYPPYRQDPMVNVVKNNLSFILMLSFIVLAPNISKEVCLEKEMRLKELMKLMGLSNWLHWFAWFLKFAIFMIISVSLMTLFLHIKLQNGAVINYTDPSITFVFLLLYGLATVFFCFAISVFCADSQAGARMGGILFLLTYIPTLFLRPRFDHMTSGQKAGTSVLHNMAMCFACDIIGLFESRGVGVQWSNLHIPYSPERNFTMLHIYLLLIMDCVIYGLIAWYFDGILPGKYGIPKVPYFPFTRQYCCGPSGDDSDARDVEPPDYGDKTEYFEKYDSSVPIGIKIRNLRKEYNVGKRLFKKKMKVAVESMSIDIFEGQITALLGPNGAGKTTTMSMLTGFIPPTKGKAYINGLSIFSNIDKIRENLGLCPQHDILFDTLTVEEHLIFFAKLRGMTKTKVKQEVHEMIKVLKLEKKTKSEASRLSGGQKRKLCVGIALIAGSKFIVLDEPTSGMDPSARRETWDILKSQRKGRTILLSTHFMDEADYLGDRIAIMASGVIQCCGTSLFLKSIYGLGYHVVMVKQPECDVKKITETVTSHVPDAKLESNISAELSFILPSESSARFQNLFTILELNKEDLGISSFGASVTTLEEVFIRVGEAMDDKLEYRLRGTPDPHCEQIENGQTNDVSAINGDITHVNDASTINYDDKPETIGTNNDDITAHSMLNGEAKHHREITRTCDDAHVSANPSDTSVSNAGANGYVNQGYHMEEERKKFKANNHDICLPSEAMPGSQSRSWTPKHLLLEEEKHKNEPENSSFTAIFGAYSEKHTGRKLFSQQFKAMFIKRLIHSGRNRLVACVQLIVPSCFAIISCAVLITFPGPRDPPPYQLTIDNFRNPVVPYLVDGSTEAGILSSIFLDVMRKSQAVEFPYVNNEAWFAENSTMDEFLALKSQESMDRYIREYNTAASFKAGADNNHSDSTFIGHFNNEAYHTAAIMLNMMGNTLMRKFVADGFKIDTTNHPLPRDAGSKVREEVDTSYFTAFIVGYNAAFGMAFLTATFVVFLIRERSSRSKHIQFVSGVHQVNYWLSTFTWDLINFLIPSMIMLIVYAAFGIEEYYATRNVGVVISVFTLYGWAILPCIYLFSFTFDVPSTGYVWISVINIITGTTAIIILMVLANPDLNALDVADVLKWVFFALLPNYCFGIVLGNLYINHNNREICTTMQTELNTTYESFCSMSQMLNITNLCCFESCGNICAFYTENMFSYDYPGAGVGLSFLAAQGLIFFIILFVKESNWANSTKQKAAISAAKAVRDDDDVTDDEDDVLNMKQLGSEKDSDVSSERERILNTPPDQLIQTDSLVIKELKKYYGSFLAVDRLSVGIKYGECFGLLGVNGAGKTTTFKMLTSDETVSAGEAFLMGCSVTDNIKEVQQKIGYCPQFDALIDQMTVRETLFMYARLRGVKEEFIPGVVNNLIDGLYLAEHATKTAENLSGGNKRKLSTAIALVGDPSVIFLDEPTTGMDPVARRLLWDTLTRVRASGRTIILTSHSMEECEALCTRLAIMVNGEFKCLGSPQHIKGKFGDGYTVIAKLRRTEDDLGTATGNGDAESMDSKTQRLMNFIEKSFPNSILKDLHTGLVQYEVSNEDLTWAEVFGKMESAKESFDLTDYSVSQTTLEQVFLNFARAQVDSKETGKRTNRSKNCCKYCCCRRCNKETRDTKPQLGH